MTPRQFREHVNHQCGFNKAKTQPQRLLESIIPNKAAWIETPTACYLVGESKPNKAVQVCNAGDWPTVEDQQRYWQERDEHLDQIESNALWFDNKAKTEIPF